jgi:hypothetical protein
MPRTRFTAGRAAMNGRLLRTAGRVEFRRVNTETGFETEAADNRRLGMRPLLSQSRTELYWSNRGDVACLRHVPGGAPDHRWECEDWKLVDLPIGRLMRMQCQHCNGAPIGQPTRRRPHRDMNRRGRRIYQRQPRQPHQSHRYSRRPVSTRHTRRQSAFGMRRIGPRQTSQPLHRILMHRHWGAARSETREA